MSIGCGHTIHQDNGEYAVTMRFTETLCPDCAKSLKEQFDERTLQHAVQLDNAQRLQHECDGKEVEIQRLWARVKRMHAALSHIQAMAEEDIANEPKETSNIWQIEADAKVALG